MGCGREYKSIKKQTEKCVDGLQLRNVFEVSLNPRLLLIHKHNHVRRSIRNHASNFRTLLLIIRDKHVILLYVAILIRVGELYSSILNTKNNHRYFYRKRLSVYQYTVRKRFFFVFFLP